MNGDLKNLIYGKNDTRYIVSVEPDGKGNCIIYKEPPGKGVVKEIVPHKPYIIFPRQLANDMRRLKGDGYYKWFKEYPTRDKWLDVLKACSRKNINVYTIRDQKESFLNRNGYTYFKGLKHKDISILSVDIEDTYGISDIPKPLGKLLLIANTYRKGDKIIRKQFAYDEYPNERLMLKAWAEFVRKINPSIILGHNLYGHDLKIIDYAAKKHRIKLKLGRDGSEMFISKRDSQYRKDGSQAYSYRNIFIHGREIVDSWFLAMKYDNSARREYENYKLKYIIKHEGLEKEDRVHYDAANIENDYKDAEKWEQIKKYNIHDSDDPLAYFDLVIPVFFQYTKSIPRSFQNIINSATGSQINSLLVRSYLQINHSLPKESEQVKYPGAISFGVPGIYKNVFKIDVQSLYPSIILTYKLIDKKKDPKQHAYRILKYFTEQRIKNKMKYEETRDIIYKILSDSQKIFINSIYGFYGAPKLLFNNPRIAAKVTEIGREILLKALEWASGSREIPENALGAKVNIEKDEF